MRCGEDEVATGGGEVCSQCLQHLTYITSAPSPHEARGGLAGVVKEVEAGVVEEHLPVVW